MKTTQHLLALLSLATICILPLPAQAEVAFKDQRAKADFEQIRTKAEQGDADAQVSLGFFYAYGVGMIDPAEAVKWYLKAAKQGELQAQHELIKRYDTGEGVVKDEAEAAKWLRKAAEQSGASKYQYRLGIRYSDGTGVVKDEAEAAKWYRKSAEQGYRSAQATLGLLYADGKGVVKNEAEAVKWLRKAAEQGCAIAQNELGMCYAFGEGVVKNDTFAYQWFLLASANGDETAKSNVPKLEKKLTAEQRAEGQRLATEWQATFEKRQGEK